jgi:hypothetical protein
MNVLARAATWGEETRHQPTERLTLLKLTLLLLPFQLLIVPGLPLNVPVSLLFLFVAVVLLLAKSQDIIWVGVEGALALFTVFALFSICLALLTTREGIFDVLPESYGLRGSRFRGLYQICIMIAWYLTAWVVVNTCITKAVLFRILKFWLLCVIAFNLYGCYEVLADQFGLPMYYVATFEVNFARPHVLGLQRSYSVFGEPTTYASFLVMNLALAWGLKMHLPDEAKSHALPVNTVFLSSCIALYLTASAAGFAAFGVVMCAMGISSLSNPSNQGKATRALLVACIALIAIVSVSGLGEELYEQKFSKAKVLADQDTEMIQSDARTRGLMLGLDAFQENLVFGVGFGNEPFYTYMPDVSELAFGTYSMIVSRLLEGGIVGTLVFAFLIWRMFFPRPWLTHEAPPGPGKDPLVRALRWALVGSMVFRLWFGPSQLNGIDWFCVGLIAAATRIAQVEHEQPEPDIL